MSDANGNWLWFVDAEPLQGLLAQDAEQPGAPLTAAVSPALVHGMLALQEGDRERAIVELQAAIDAGEQQPELFLLLGQIHFESSHFEAAELVYGRYADLETTSALAHYNRAVCLEKLNRWGDAAAHFRKATQCESDLRDAWLGLGLSSLHIRRADEALAAFDRYLADVPESEPAHFGRAVALQMLRRFDEAEAIYSQFALDGEPSAELLANQLALSVGRRDAAVVRERAARLAELRPDSPHGQEAVCYVAILAEDWPAVVEHLAAGAEEFASSPDWAYAAAYALWRCDRPDTARRVLTRLLAQSPAHGPATLLHGLLLEEAGDAEQALSAYRRAASLLPNPAAAARNLGRLAARERRAAVCRQAAEMILEAEPGSPDGHFAQGLAALLDRAPAEAERSFAAALAQRPDWAEAEWNLGLARLECGRAAEAEKSLTHSLEHLPPDAADAHPLVRCVLEQGDLERALTLFQALPPETVPPELAYNLAVAFQEAGKLDEAEPLYRHVIASGAEAHDAWVNLGHLYLAVGRPADAEACWQAAG